tara:strand:- start:2283 stop:2849 length:567 start_codon:yes stop_codon:yes gene_type:complete
MSKSTNQVQMLLQQMETKQVGSAVENTYQFLKGHMSGTTQDKIATFSSPYLNLKTKNKRNMNDNEDNKRTAKTYADKINMWRTTGSKDKLLKNLTNKGSVKNSTKTDEQYNRLSRAEQNDYNKAMATKYKKEGLGTYRPPKNLDQEINNLYLALTKPKLVSFNHNKNKMKTPKVNVKGHSTMMFRDAY